MEMDGGKQEAALGAGAAHSEALNFIVNAIIHNKTRTVCAVNCNWSPYRTRRREVYTSSVVIDEVRHSGRKIHLLFRTAA